mgnify:CR=1 FL=1
MRYSLSATLLAALLGCGGAQQAKSSPPSPATGTEAPLVEGGDFVSVELRSQRYSAEIMGGLFHIDLVQSNAKSGNLKELAESAFLEARRIENLLNLWGQSTLSVWNEVSARLPAGPLAINAELADLLQAALVVAEQTGGAFDPTVAPVLRDLGFYGGPVLAIDESLRESWRSRVGFQRVSIPQVDIPEGARSSDGRMVERWSGGVEFDLSSMAKGYAAECMAEVLRKGGISNAKISAGSSSVLCFGPGLGGVGTEPGWPVELPHPDRPVTWWLLDEAISTSGQSSITLKGAHKGKSHILDPRTLVPIRHRTQMVVVRGDSAAHCDMLSTALLVMGVDEGSVWFDGEETVMFYAIPLVGDAPDIQLLKR